VNRGDNIRVVNDPEELATGWEGVVLSTKGKKVTVWLDQDEYSSEWEATDLEYKTTE
jgi:hypothetical protein